MVITITRYCVVLCFALYLPYKLKRRGSPKWQQQKSQPTTPSVTIAVVVIRDHHHDHESSRQRPLRQPTKRRQWGETATEWVGGKRIVVLLFLPLIQIKEQPGEENRRPSKSWMSGVVTSGVCQGTRTTQLGCETGEWGTGGSLRRKQKQYFVVEWSRKERTVTAALCPWTRSDGVVSILWGCVSSQPVGYPRKSVALSQFLSLEGGRCPIYDTIVRNT